MTSAAAKAYQPAADVLRDRVILVTGAGDGLGRAAAHAFAQHGASVILLGRTVRKLEQVYDEILAAGGPEPVIVTLDLARAHGPDYAQLAEQIDSNWGRLDGLLHNAAMLGERAPIDHYDIGIWHQVMHLDLNVPFILTQTLLPLLRKAADPSVIFTSSSVGRRGRAYWGAYSVAKAGIENLSQVLADENEGRLRVNSINPGASRTRMRREAYPGEDPKTRPEPAALMGPYLYLIGPASHGVTGQSIDCQ
ncbi:MAG: YciK family oxidoreductase [Gammaproteobacteria bacterium]|nr:YciK family oxidoreductase [Gammaproteobacteria bacterium]